jgi:hypothetical protein
MKKVPRMFEKITPKNSFCSWIFHISIVEKAVGNITLVYSRKKGHRKKLFPAPPKRK